MIITRRVSAAGLVAALGGALVVVVPPAPAAITQVDDPSAAAAAIMETPGALVSAQITGASGAHAIADTAAAGFPTHGSSYLVLSTGDATAITGTGPQGSSPSTDWHLTSPHPHPTGATNWRPADASTVHDLVTLQLVVDVPAGAPCLSFESRFLSEELSQGSEMANDGFVVSATTPTQSWPDVAFDPDGRRIETFSSKVDPDAYAGGDAHTGGTVFNGGTDTYTSTLPVTAGQTTLTFQLYDATPDGLVDSAVFIDHLGFGPNCHTPLTTTLTGPAQISVGEAHPFTLSVTNPTAADLPLDSLTALMPPGVDYVAGSSTGVTTDDPTQVGSQLRWSDLGTLAAEETATLQFSVRGLSTGSGRVDAEAVAGESEGADSAALEVVKGASSITAAVTKTSRKVKVSGAVLPDHPGADVTVTLLRKKHGAFRKVARSTRTLDADSAFRAAFGRPAAGRCRVTAAFGGSADYRGSKVTKTFGC